VAGHFKQAVATNSGYDIVRFDNQRLNWTLKEFDVSQLLKLNDVHRGIALLLLLAFSSPDIPVEILLSSTPIKPLQLSSLSLKWVPSRLESRL
jgi:hypothetical protein